VLRIATSLNGDTIAAQFSDATLVVYNTLKCEIVGLHRGQKGRINSILWDDLNPQLFYTSSNDGSISRME
jgi:WD40 repeat protein